MMDQVSCTTSEAAKSLGICVRTTQLWVEAGRLRAWKTPGGHRRILCESVNEILREREVDMCVAAPEFDVLVVEDERVQRQFLQTMLGKISPGITVRTAYNGVEGLIKIGEKQPQVLVTDLLMPGLDGFHLLNTLIASPLVQPLQIIVITSLTADEIRESGGLPEGVVTFHKPLDMVSLLSMVRAYYDQWVRKPALAG